MKKVIVAALCMCGIGMMTAFGDVVTNVYNLSMSLKTPTLANGVRTVTSQSYKGYLYMEYADGDLGAVWAEVTSSKTKVTHLLSFTDGFYNLIGKETKQSIRSVPTMYLCGADDFAYGCSSKYGQNETIQTIALAGFGSLKSIKTVTVTCEACVGEVKNTEYCNKLNSISGSVVGVMTCECPDEEDDWWHTVKAGLCGVLYDDAGDYERLHNATFHGTWKASYNRKLSETK